ncbi:hypothetical protein OIDMADRAFT_133801 [Oidiodendron maius Zn]|uniref:Tyrosinase copper-binding domain-containing protein n=1 Tax=Oidiodendron maius (strain Zn) TaxID=913774 RepID=A0A0C3D1N7_OIDMZ|nr:hypothetical protein OIDMADRAFT_133801 [Oidiodendron maius Zn]
MRPIFFIPAASLIITGFCISNASSAHTPRVSLAELQQQAYQNQLTELSRRTSGCTLENVAVRKEWQETLNLTLRACIILPRSNHYAYRSSLTAEQQINYTNAVLCLQSKPAITPRSVASGVRSRFDDFAATHINQTLIIHFASIFFAWHRYFVHTYEQALINECGYSGIQPYWNWSDNAADPLKNTLFDGSETSIGGDGAYIPHNVSLINIPVINITVTLPGGTGSGCIYSGPFRNMTVNLGPNSALDYNPRCLTRDFRGFLSNEYLTYDNITSLITGSNDLNNFTDTVNLSNGIHSKAHQTVGGLELDLYASAGDPAFYFIHTQLDHVWNTWQWLDPKTRINQVSGTLTFQNIPPSANGTLSTPMDLGYNAGPVLMKDVVSTIDGPFCYIYE